MRLGPRTKLLLIGALFALPIAASSVAYLYYRPAHTSNYGELLLPPTAISAAPLRRVGGGHFEFGELRGRWVLVASDSGACPQRCVQKLTVMRQVRLALGRNASRVERAFVVDDATPPEAPAMAPFEGTAFALPPEGARLPAGAANDREHIYLLDPRGNVMMRWPAAADGKRMLKDLDRLLRASQMG